MNKETRISFPLAIGQYLGRGIYYDLSRQVFLATRQSSDPKNRAQIPLVAGISVGCLPLVRWIDHNFLIETVSYRILALLVLAVLVVLATRLLVRKTYANLTLREIDLSREEIQELIKNGKKALIVLSITFCITVLVGAVSLLLYILTSNFTALFVILTCIFVLDLLVETHFLKRYGTVRFLERESRTSDDWS